MATEQCLQAAAMACKLVDPPFPERGGALSEAR